MTPRPRKPEPTTEQIVEAVETVLDAALLEVTVLQDGRPSSLYRLVHALDRAGLIDWKAVGR